MDRYLAVVDDGHDAEDPITVVRVVEGGGVTALNEDAAWVRTTLLDRIEAGEIPYRAESITAEAATRVRDRRERTIVFRYFLVVRDDDPADDPVGVLREWDASGGAGSYSEQFTRDGEWRHSTIRLDIERGGNAWARIVPSDAATVHRVIDSQRRRGRIR